MDRISRYEATRREIAFAMMDVGAVLTDTSVHPLVSSHRGPGGMERGFKFNLHKKNPDAPLSPLYLNLRTPDNPTKPGPLTQHIVDLAAHIMRHIELFEAKLEFDAVTGVPWAGNPFAKALASLAGKPYIPTEKCGSLRSSVPSSVRKVLLVENVITKGTSTRAAVQNLRDADLEVTDVLALVDYEFGCREELAKLGCNLYSAFMITELMNLWVDAGKMAPRMHVDVERCRQAYRALPA